MEKIPTPSSEKISENKQEGEYNFPELKELKPAVLFLVERLKSAIETGEYKTLISDDAGARIPTLVLRKIFQEKSPDLKAPQTYFLAMGKRKRADWDAIEKFIKAKKDKLGKTLIITEYVSSGETEAAMRSAFDRAGFTNYNHKSLYYEYGNIQGEPIAPEYIRNQTLLPKLGGVRKKKRFKEEKGDLSRIPAYVDESVGAHPELIKKTTSNPELSSSLREKIKKGLDTAMYDQWRWVDVYNAQRVLKQAEGKRERTKEEQMDIQTKINKARQDVGLIAKEVIAEVWSEK